jgi:hypothetical protein
MAEAMLIAQAASGVMSGIAGAQEAAGEAERARINSYIARTRGMQADTTARQGLEDELGSMRAAMSAMGNQPNVGSMELMNELRGVRNRERRIDQGNHRSEAADWRMQGRNARARGAGALVGGFSRAVQPAFSLFDMRG